MVLPDINILVQAFREDSPRYAEIRPWFEDLVEALRSLPNCVLMAAGPRHWSIFTRLCRNSVAQGNLIPDAYLAALAIESGSEWITTDRDFGRFAGLRWSTPT